MAVLVDKTSEYTVEFWFKAFSSVADALEQDNNGLTYLFRMEDQDRKRAMDIYVENNELKCAPFGQTSDAGTVLNYEGIDPLRTKEWQHITCILVNDRYVKGQYLKIDIETEAVGSFSEDILRPSTFAKSVADFVSKNDNISEQRRWTVILGNEEPKYFAGSFKDVKVWKTARSDAELYSKRFN